MPLYGITRKARVFYTASGALGSMDQQVGEKSEDAETNQQPNYASYQQQQITCWSFICRNRISLIGPTYKTAGANPGRRKFTPKCGYALPA